MPRSALIVVHMQQGFLVEGHPLFCGAPARKIIPSVVRLTEREQARGSLIVLTKDTHRRDDQEFQMFPPHCVAGTAENELVEELQGFKGISLSSTRFDLFHGTRLEKILKSHQVRDLILCGVCTDICVLYTAAAARFRDWPVTVYRDCVASFDRAGHRFALAHMEKVLGVKVGIFDRG